MYISVPVSDAATAVQRTTVFSEEMNSWLSASRLRLNSVKTEVMWFGSGQQINQVDVSDILILSSSIKVVESARDLGVIIDSQLSLSSHVAVLCWSGFYRLRLLRPLCWSLQAEATKTLSTGVHFMSPGLLQLFAVWSDRQTHAASTVGAKCCGKADHRSETSRTHHTDIASTSLVSSQTTS